MYLLHRFKKMKNNGIFFLLPALVIVVALLVYPVLSSIFYSLTSKNLIRLQFDIVWLDNFIFVLTSKEFYQAFLNSFKWTIFSIGGQLLVGLTAALAINRLPKLSGIYKTMLIIPWAFPAILIGLGWKWILDDVNGFLPNFLMGIGLTENAISFLSDPNFVFATVVLINIWFGAPLFMVNILSALKTIPLEQYEAAQIDGANVFQSFWNITLRHIRIVIGSLLIVRTIWVFNNFEILFLLTGGGPANMTTTLPIFAYQTGWGLQQLGIASAITVILLLFLIVICFLFFKLLDRWEREDH
ncbi:carbohydrate ABC transporter permease [Oceanobacillus jeddahense]|uniref:carbohydrate ABC transporter permease n=1 Tax=Oceanobacillus jeddahense TaxID=1462527 RepID=UPI00059626D3|nr:sugar ABC transporter permease [Oceanobacillus jeddahense]